MSGMLRLLTLCLTIAIAVLTASADGHARVHRALVGQTEGGRVPDTFDEVLRHAERSGWAVLWSNPPSFDPYYAGSGATVASLGLDRGQGIAVSITWAAFVDAGEAAQFVEEQRASAQNGYVAYDFAAEIDGRLVVTAHDYGAPPRQAEVGLAYCLGRRR